MICDCHVHVFEMPEAYPFQSAPAYAPPYSPVPELERTARVAGFDRMVLVQPIPYGTDLSLLLASLGKLENRARGIAVANEKTDIETLAKLKQSGIRGLRFVQNGMPGTVSMDALLDHLAPKLAELSLHAEIWAPLPEVLSRWDRLERTGLPIVLDHMGCVDTSSGIGHADFQTLLALVREGRLWVKLAVCRRATPETRFAAARPFHDALIEANDGRLVWATDFPFVRYTGPAPDAADLLSLFENWVRDPTAITRILSENPAALYGF